MSLRGERVGLTALRESDVEILLDWINDRDLVQLSAPYRPVDERDHRRWFDSIRARSDVEIFGIRTLAGDELIGTCQLLHIDPVHRTAELQIRIARPEARGRGFGTEALGLLLAHAFRDLGLHRVQLHVLSSNHVALCTYEGVGFEREGLLREAAWIDNERVDLVIMGILRDRFEPS